MGSGGSAVSKRVWLRGEPGEAMAEPSARMELSLPMTGRNVACVGRDSLMVCLV